MTFTENLKHHLPLPNNADAISRDNYNSRKINSCNPGTGAFIVNVKYGRRNGWTRQGLFRASKLLRSGGLITWDAKKNSLELKSGPQENACTLTTFRRSSTKQFLLGCWKTPWTIAIENCYSLSTKSDKHEVPAKSHEIPNSNELKCRVTTPINESKRIKFPEARLSTTICSSGTARQSTTICSSGKETQPAHNR